MVAPVSVAAGTSYLGAKMTMSKAGLELTAWAIGTSATITLGIVIVAVVAVAFTRI